MKSYEVRLLNFMQNFEKILGHGINSIKQNNIPEALVHIKSAKNILGTIKHILRQFKSYEKYIIRLSGKEGKILQKEENGK